MPGYRHRQLGTATLWVIGGAFVFTSLLFGALAAASDESLGIVPLILMGFVACAVLFGTLTVEVSPERVRLWFGVGLIRKTFRVQHIRRAEAVTNAGAGGWGIRWGSRGWVYSVSGNAAVEIELESGRRYWIGTDQPQELVAAIRRAMESG